MQPTGSQRVGHDLVAEKQQVTDLVTSILLSSRAGQLKQARSQRQGFFAPRRS